MHIFAVDIRYRALMNKETMTKLIADYFKTQPVLKVWLFGSFSRGGTYVVRNDVHLHSSPDPVCL